MGTLARNGLTYFKLQFNEKVFYVFRRYSNQAKLEIGKV